MCKKTTFVLSTRKIRQVAYSRPENPMKNETFGSFFKILIGQIQPQAPRRFWFNWIFSLRFLRDFGEQKANEIFSGTQISLGILKGISQAIPQSN